MKLSGAVALGFPAILAFRGPDAVRYLNGQVTQDVRKVVGTVLTAASCVTDAKGKLQFMVAITEGPNGALWVVGAHEHAEELEARLTRYLIADDVEVEHLTGKFCGWHVLAPESSWQRPAMVRESERFGVIGEDWWVSEGEDFSLPTETKRLVDEQLEAMRIQHRVPAWGKELLAGMLPPEARLEAAAISYSKGCYIGQEVISRIKSAGKVNRYLHAFQLRGNGLLPKTPLRLLRADGRAVGEITSVSPVLHEGGRAALGYLRRGEEANSWAIERTPNWVASAR